MKRQRLKFEIWLHEIRVIICKKCFEWDVDLNFLKQNIIENENFVCDRWSILCEVFLISRIVWKCNFKWMINFI